MTHRTDWFHAARWGVFTHYLAAPASSEGHALGAEAWNAQVEAFDVVGLADQLSDIGTPFYWITLGQNSGHYCAPNATYDRLVGITPSKCARRDLISDLYAELAPRGIALLVYLPSGAPAADAVARERLAWQWGFADPWPQGWRNPTGERLAAFQLKWEAVIREWSLRWGERVRGWWFDGCYFADAMYRHPEPPNFASFAAAARAGNPESLIAFNPGVMLTSLTPEEDITAGEITDPLTVACPGRWLDGAQTHMLSYLGPSWGQEPPRFTTAEVIACTKQFTDRGGVVSWDVPITPAGLIPPAFVAQLKGLGKAMRG